MINIINLRSINEKWTALPPLAVDLGEGCVRTVRWAQESSRPKQTVAANPANRKLLQQVIADLDLYCAGKLERFDWPLDWSQGTQFQRRVWRALQEIPSGETRSYQWVAKRIRSPRSVRAVGQANGANPFSLIVPCHRIIRSDGSIGGYAGGVSIKQKLLDLENRSIGERVNG